MKMAVSVAEEKLARSVYDALQSASCPLVDGVNLQEAESMLQLLCVPSQHRTDILEWIYNSVNTPFCTSKAVRSNNQDTFYKDMAMLGHELMLCKADDLDLINGNASFRRQLQFLQQLLSVVPACKESCGVRTDAELLLNELFSAENQNLLSQMLQPSQDPWPSHMSLKKVNKSSSNPSSEDAADVATLLQQTRSALEQLQSECEFLNGEAPTPTPTPQVFSAGSLQVAACDLKQLMATFHHVYETELRVYCNREPPSFSADTRVFQRVHRLLLALNTELELLKEVTNASVSTNDGGNQLQTRSQFQPSGQKDTFQDQLDQLSRQIKDFSSLLQS